MISLVLPIYNVKTEYLKACFDSIRQQSYRDFEALMVDDGSDPFVAVVCAEYATWDPRFRYLRQENAGVCAARNAGLNAASGTYVCFIDPDDWLSERYLEVLHRAINDEDADMAMVDSMIHYKNRTVENHFLNSGTAVLQDGGKNRLLYRLFSRTICDYYPPEIPAGTAWAKIFRTEFLRENGLRFLPGLKRMEDILFCMYAYEAAGSIAYRPECLYHYRVSGDSVSHRYDPEVIQTFETFFQEAKRFLDINEKERLLYDALAMRELTAVHSYLRFYYFRDRNKTPQEVNREIDALLMREPYLSALQQMNPKLLSKTEFVFVSALRKRQYGLLRALVKGRELVKR